jgi:glycosyltransferase involved in cell wall biosynthesis
VIPVLSIIIPTFNSEETISATLESVVSQSFNSMEVLVMDGLSKDKTCEIVKEYESKYDFIRLISEKDEGVYDAMNKGISLTTGGYLYFLGSDDVFYEIETLENLFSKTPFDIDVFYGDVLFKNSKRVYSGESNIQKLVYDQVSICHQAIFYSRKTFDLIGNYNLKYFIHADYDFNIRCFRNEDLKIQYFDQIIAIFNEAGLSGLQSNKDGFHTELTALNICEKYDTVELFFENEKLKEKYDLLVNSRANKLGNRILGPFRFVKKLFK